VNPDLIVAAMAAPGALTGAVLGITAWCHRGEADRDLAVVAAFRATTTTDDDTPPPPDGGMPTPAEGDHLAEVIAFPRRYAA
jgi:hypothetical protein